MLSLKYAQLENFVVVTARPFERNPGKSAKMFVLKDKSDFLIVTLNYVEN